MIKRSATDGDHNAQQVFQKPSYLWSSAEWQAFRMRCHPTRRFAELAPRIVPLVLGGRTQAEVGKIVGCSKQYVSLVVIEYRDRVRLRMRQFYEGRRNLGRPIDMGGPRDEWIDRDLEDEWEAQTRTVK